MRKTINGVEVDIAPSADLYDANLRAANLRAADLRCADLRCADLRCANLYGANLYGADLRSADLSGADLYDANLRAADLRGADLRCADLRCADLRCADLSGANLYGADLSGANLYDAKVGAGLYGAQNLPPLFEAMTVIAGEGDLIGYKRLAREVICKLKIPADAKRSNSTGRKCRAEFAIVLEGEGFSKHDKSFEYKIGATVRPTQPFDENRWDECAPGIHFFLTRIEAENY